MSSVKQAMITHAMQYGRSANVKHVRKSPRFARSHRDLIDREQSVSNFDLARNGIVARYKCDLAMMLCQAIAGIVKCLRLGPP